MDLFISYKSHFSKKNLIVAFLLFLSNVANCQDFSCSMGVGIGTYQFEDLRSVNNYLLNELPFTAKLVNDFPPTIYYRPSISVKYSQFGFGYLHSYVSTGSRISAKDYSGVYRADIITSAHNPNLHLDVYLTKDKKLNSDIRLMIGLYFTRLSLEEYFEVQEEVYVDNELSFKSVNFSIEPSYSLSYPIGAFTIEWNIGYQAILGKNPLKSSSGDEELRNVDNGDTISPDWSGLRTGFTLSYTFISNSK